MKRRAQILTLKLKPLNGGAYTQLFIAGWIVPTRPHPKSSRQLVALLKTCFGGGDLHVALPADAPLGWLDIWNDNLAEAPDHKLRFSFSSKARLPAEHNDF